MHDSIPMNDASSRRRVAGDRPWQHRLRILQELWREEHKLEAGMHKGRPLGSRLATPEAEETLANYLTDTIRAVVRAELASEQARRERKLFSKPRIYDDLLSSQPLCFNLFGEMKADLVLATAWARCLWPDRVAEVTRLEFEYSPGRRDPKYLDNRTAFDVYLEHETRDGGRGFIGIEVKYHEDLKVKPAETRDRVREVARSSGVFVDANDPALAAPPLQQIWFDHLLALSMLQAESERWKGTGLYVLLHPVINEACDRVVDAYVARLRDGRTFQRLTLEDAVTALETTCAKPWVGEFRRRYLDYGRCDAVCGGL